MDIEKRRSGPSEGGLQQVSWNSALVRYGLAVVAAFLGLLARLALEAWAGPGLPTFITFYPGVMAVALLGGLGPGLVATVAAALVADYWVIPPAGFAIERPVDAVGLVFFSGMGVFMSLVAEDYRRARRKAEAFDRERAGKQLRTELEQRLVELQAANEALSASRKAALNLMEEALGARKQAEAANAELRSLSEQRRLALEAADLGAWDYHFQAGEVFWDERCREMWGMAEAEHVDYATAISRIHPEDRAGVDAAINEALSGRKGGGYHSEFRVVWPDGSVRWIASHGRVYFEGEGEQRHAVRFIGANLDITAERQALEALRESQERLAAFAAATFEGIVLSERGRIVDCNEQFAQMLGCTVQQVKGRAIAEFVAPEDRERVVENIRAGRESLLENQMVRRDGSRITVEAHGRPSHASHKGVRHTAVRDITERKQREQLLERLNRTLKALKDSSQAMMRAATEGQYLDEVCRILMEDCGHAMVWIGLAEHDEARSIRPVACAGFEEGYLETLNLTWADTERGRGPTGTAIRTGNPAACQNMHTDPQFGPWRAEALKRGYASSLVVPLLEEGGEPRRGVRARPSAPSPSIPACPKPSPRTKWRCCCNWARTSPIASGCCGCARPGRRRSAGPNCWPRN